MASEALWTVDQDPAAVSTLVEALHDKNQKDRAGIAVVLGRLGADAARPTLVEALKDDDIQVRANAAEALWRMEQHPAAVPALIAVLQAKHPFWQYEAVVKVLGAIGLEAKAATPALIERFKDDSYGLRVEIARTLGKIGPGAKAAVPMLRDALKDDPSEVVRMAAAEGLGGIGPEARSAVPALVDALDDEELSVRRQAATALQAIDGEAAFKAGVR